MANVLAELVAQLNSGALRVIDLTQPLSAETPLLPLPPQWPNTPKFRLWEISRYGDRGPAWYWNCFETGKHTGTHFYPPVHWVRGKHLPESSLASTNPKTVPSPPPVAHLTAPVPA